MKQYSAAAINQFLNGALEGNETTLVSTIAKIEEGDADSICFISNPKYEHYANTCICGVLIVRNGLAVSNKNVGAIVRVEDPYSAFSKLLAMYQTEQNTSSGIEEWAFIAKDVSIGEGVYVASFSYVSEGAKLGNYVCIYPNSFIGEGVEIGNNTTIHAGVKIYQGCKIGNNCIVHSGAVIGADGFGFAPQPDGSYAKIPQTGIVVIEDNVEIGANACIDRATIGATTIKKGVKIDNLVTIAHNVEVGMNTVIAAQAGVAGSTKLGKQMMVGGQAGIVGHLTLADGTKINAQSGISKSVTEPNTSLTGSPAMEFRTHYRMYAQLKTIPELLKRIEALEKKG